MTYNELCIASSQCFSPKKLKYIFASHANPDIIASLARWLSGSETKLLFSSLWSRFVQHFCQQGKRPKDASLRCQIREHCCHSVRPHSTFHLLPAHFLHSEGNSQFYDPISRILFSGDMGASMLPQDRVAPVTDFAQHLPFMRSFHTRDMVSNKVCRYWVNLVRANYPEWIVSQHGAPLKGSVVIG